MNMMRGWAAMLCVGLTLAWPTPASAAEGEPAVQIVQPTTPTPLPMARDVEVPRDGGIMLGMGSALLGGGVLLAAFGGGLLPTAEGRPSDLMAYSATAFAVGGASIGVGALMMARGLRLQRDYRGWDSVQAEPIPRRGNGMIGTGVGLMVSGLAIGSVAALVWSDNLRYVSDGYHGYPDSVQPPTVALSQVAFSVGAVSFATGAVLLALGFRANTRHMRWRQGFVPTRLEHTPQLGWGRGGVRVGVGGRF